MTGQRFGRLVAVNHLFKQNTWRCRCDCGRYTLASGWHLRHGGVRSCGCLNSELAAARKRTHGLTHTREYIIWAHIKARCLNPSDKGWKYYGGRGIQMHRAWADSFESFLLDVGPRPSPSHSIDRINNDGHYEPGNVRWATRQQQANNTRINRRIEWNGRTQTLSQWAHEIGVGVPVLHRRLFGLCWPLDRAMTRTPAPRASVVCRPASRQSAAW